MYTLQAAARLGEEEGHEHFGFMDGISNPAITGLNGDISVPGQAAVAPGAIFVGESGDKITDRPSWAKGGSFLVFRQLMQLVPEFKQRVRRAPPVDISPTVDNPELGADPGRNNYFTFMHPPNNIADQTWCPFSAHIRKMNPREDLPPHDHYIMRAGIPYGPEVSNDEVTSSDALERGLAFVAYQSDIGEGFRFQQKEWANSPKFNHDTGVDPIVGALAAVPRTVSGLDPTKTDKKIKLLTGKFYFTLFTLSMHPGLTNHQRLRRLARGRVLLHPIPVCDLRQLWKKMTRHSPY
ncbi:hypothetical protein B0H14DRAFT_2580679 [Mycena olivaceomarginata]|nr:hypothetical protein B0H14DRAFT_2580679 [Mycena olivaceomarginata]